MSALSSIVNGSSPAKTKQMSAPLPSPAPAPSLAPTTTIAAAAEPSLNGKTSTPTITTTTTTTTTTAAAPTAPTAAATPVTAIDDVKYKRKYKDLKKRIRDIEDDNDVLNIKLSRARKNIHRLRVERGFLFDRIDQTEHPINAATALTSSSSSSSVSSSDLDSDADQNGNRSSRSHRQHPRHGLDQSRSRNSRYSSALGSSSHLHHTTSISLAVPGSSLSHSRLRTPPSRASSIMDVTSHGASLSPSSGKKAVKKRRKDPLAPKRPSNAFFIFSQQHRQQAREEKKEGNQSELTKFLGQQWKSMPTTEKQIYSDLAVQDRQRYLDEMSHYNENGINSATPSPKKKPGRPGRPPKATRLETADVSTRHNSETPAMNGESTVNSNSINYSSNNNKMGILSLVNDEDVEDMSSHEGDLTHMSFEDEHEQEDDDDDEEDEDEDVGEVEDRHHHHPGHSSMMDIKRNSLGEADVEMTQFHSALPTLSVNGLLVNN